MNIIEMDWLPLGKGDYITAADIGLAVYAETGARMDMIRSLRCDAETVMARHLVMCLARELTGRSYPQIGRDIGGKDHTSVLNGYKRMAARLDISPGLAELADRRKRRAMAIAASNRKGCSE